MAPIRISQEEGVLSPMCRDREREDIENIEYIEDFPARGGR